MWWRHFQDLNVTEKENHRLLTQDRGTRIIPPTTLAASKESFHPSKEGGQGDICCTWRSCRQQSCGFSSPSQLQGNIQFCLDKTILTWKPNIRVRQLEVSMFPSRCLLLVRVPVEVVGTDVTVGTKQNCAVDHCTALLDCMSSSSSLGIPSQSRWR